jgi:hypothetical protein
MGDLAPEPGKLIRELDVLIQRKVKRDIGRQLDGPEAFLEKSADGASLPDGTEDVYNLVLNRIVQFSSTYRGERAASSWSWISKIAFSQAVSEVRKNLVAVEEDPPEEDAEVDELVRMAEGAERPPGASESRQTSPAKKKIRFRKAWSEDESTDASLLESLTYEEEFIDLEGYHPIVPRDLAKRVNIFRGNPESLLEAIEDRFVGEYTYKRTLFFAIRAAHKEKRRARVRDILIYHRRQFRGESYDVISLRFRISKNLAQQAFRRGQIAFFKAAKKLGTLPEYPSRLSESTKPKRP